MEKDLGYLQLNEDGAVLSSSGELQNNEVFATNIMALLTLTNQVDAKAFGANRYQEDDPTLCTNVLPSTCGTQVFKRLTITYDDHCYLVCLSNRKIHIVKRALGEHGHAHGASNHSNPQSIIA